MRTLFDVNVLIALFDPAHVHHNRAHDWWEEQQNTGWASSALTQNGFVRILSQPRYPNAITTTDAILRLRAATAQSNHAFWADEIAVTDKGIFSAERILGPKQVTDIYLLALAKHFGGRLATFDRALSATAVIDAKPEHYVVI